jgi:hypothetical protein
LPCIQRASTVLKDVYAKFKIPEKTTGVIGESNPEQSFVDLVDHLIAKSIKK